MKSGAQLNGLFQILANELLTEAGAWWTSDSQISLHQSPVFRSSKKIGTYEGSPALLAHDGLGCLVCLELRLGLLAPFLVVPFALLSSLRALSSPINLSPAIRGSSRTHVTHSILTQKTERRDGTGEERTWRRRAAERQRTVSLTQIRLPFSAESISARVPRRPLTPALRDGTAKRQKGIQTRADRLPCVHLHM